LGDEEGNSFNIKDAIGWDRLNHPQGCFAFKTALDATETMYWNPIDENAVPSGTNITGHPLCKAPYAVTMTTATVADQVSGTGTQSTGGS
jgi:hypothetical protein